MIKAETAPVISGEFPQGKADEFIWLDGQPWSIPAEDDKRLIRLEIFGNELENAHIKALGGGVSMYSTPQLEHEQPKLILRTFKLEDARYVSRQMRVFYP